MRERGAYSPLTHTPPHTPHTPTLNTCIHLSASVLSDVLLLLRLEHPPQSSRVPIPFTHTLHSSIHPSVHNTPAGGRDGAFQEKEREKRDGRTTTTPFSLSLPLGQPPSTFTAHPKPCRAGEGRSTTTTGAAAVPPSPHASLFSYCLHTAPSVLIASSRIQPLSPSLSTPHTPPQARIQSADPPAEALLQCRCR